MLRQSSATITLPEVVSDPGHKYIKPKKVVVNEQMMCEWKSCEAYHEYLGFIKAMNLAVRGKSNNQPCHVSEVTKGILNVISSLDCMVTEIPPIDQPQRFGNKAFKTWYERVQQEAGTLLQSNLPEEFHQSIVEIADYLIESFGNSTRIDYGTGHEMSFCIFLYCLFKIGAFKAEDSVAVVNQIFKRYLDLARRLQTTYRMEPAGSHGVWSLDDYQFVPFVWGSSQFVGRPVIDPKMFVQDDVIKKYTSEFMFISCIDYITKVKTGEFFEHSNQLWNISGIPSWTKINEGLIKMYQGEVLHKFPVIQHVLFGSLLRFIPFSASATGSSSLEKTTFKKPVLGDP